MFIPSSRMNKDTLLEAIVFLCAVVNLITLFRRMWPMAEFGPVDMDLTSIYCALSFESLHHVSLDAISLSHSVRRRRLSRTPALAIPSLPCFLAQLFTSSNNLPPVHISIPHLRPRRLRTMGSHLSSRLRVRPPRSAIAIIICGDVSPVAVFGQDEELAGLR